MEIVYDVVVNKNEQFIRRIPFSSFRLTSSFKCSIKYLQIWVFPPAAAKCSAVRPLESLILSNVFANPSPQSSSPANSDQARIKNIKIWRQKQIEPQSEREREITYPSKNPLLYYRKKKLSERIKKRVFCEVETNRGLQKWGNKKAGREWESGKSRDSGWFDGDVFSVASWTDRYSKLHDLRLGCGLR